MKKYLLGVAIVLFGITTTAFVVKHNQTTNLQTEVWFDFNGTPSEVDDETKYSTDANNTPECATSATYRCEIKAPVLPGSSPAMPDLDQIVDFRYKSQP